MGEVLEVELVLLPFGLVEPQLLALVLLERLRALAASECRDRVARERAEEDEVERDRDENCERSEEHALPDVVEAPHSSSSASLPPIRPGAAASSTSSRTRSGAGPCRPMPLYARRCTAPLLAGCRPSCRRSSAPSVGRSRLACPRRPSFP